MSRQGMPVVCEVPVLLTYILLAILPFTHTNTWTQCLVSASCRTQASVGEEATCVIYFHSHCTTSKVASSSSPSSSPLFLLSCLHFFFLSLNLRCSVAGEQSCPCPSVVRRFLFPRCSAVMSKSLFASSLVACFIATMAQEV